MNVSRKSNTIYLLFNHQLTSFQIDQLTEIYKVDKIIELTSNLLKFWKNISPDCNLDLVEHLKPIVDFFEKSENMGYVLVQGDFGATYYMVSRLKNLGYIPIYATTKREVIEETQNDGTILTKRIFKHVCFRIY